ncbi:unnamed protein product [Linum tenue]|uniref:Uncharacterized protein n=1 Tax=Linum tenue TaxID=586396 RepID=A0AAV0K9K7_9ROSI|nr:unnamed protein product [Linum tenue]
MCCRINNLLLGISGPIFGKRPCSSAPSLGKAVVTRIRLTSMFRGGIRAAALIADGPSPRTDLACTNGGAQIMMFVTLLKISYSQAIC